MKKIIKNKILLYIICISGIVSCSDMDDNYKDYLAEKQYSGGIKNLKSQIGFERIYLSWDSPIDNISRKIRIEYGNNEVIETEELTNNYVVENLKTGNSYTFKVYTVDKFGNLSVPASISALPISQYYIDRIAIPDPNINRKATSAQLIWYGLQKNTQLRFTGEMEYSYLSNGVLVEGKTPKKSYGGNDVISFTLNNIQSNEEITFNYTMRYVPLVAGKEIVDTIQKTNRILINVFN